MAMPVDLQSLGLATQRELARWYKLKDHPVQQALITDDVRFKVVPAGRRSGKTERAKRYVAKEALANPNERYFIAAPTRDQVKKIYWADMKKLCLVSLASKAPSETELIIYLDNGTEVHLIGLDKPQRIEGIVWSGGVIDEIADIKPEAWPNHIRPALDTFNPSRPEYKAWCWLIGVPDGLNHYHDMYQYAISGNDPDWKAYHWTSAEILPADKVAAAKRQMSAKSFRQEYEASFEGATGRIYEDYGPENFTQFEIAPHEQLRWMHDFNFTPMSSAIGVVRDDYLLILDEVILTSATARQSALEFVEKYADHRNRHVLIYGDPAGKAGEKHGHTSDYLDIEEVLRMHGWTYERRVRPAAPAIKDRHNAVRAKILNAAGERRLYVNAQKAPYSHKGLATVQLKPGSAFQEEVTDYQHVTTAIGYMVDYEWPVKRVMSYEGAVS